MWMLIRSTDLCVSCGCQGAETTASLTPSHTPPCTPAFLAPAAKIADLSDVVVVAASGTTGAGRSAKINLIASEVMGSLTSYKFGGVHQHTPEIEESITRATGTAAKISFTPILAPMPRGILATITMKVNSSVTTEAAHKIYVDAYKGEEFEFDF